MQSYAQLPCSSLSVGQSIGLRFSANAHKLCLRIRHSFHHVAEMLPLSIWLISSCEYATV